MHINEQPTSFWRTRERFLVAPGLTTVRAISGYCGDVHYQLVQFTTEAGHSYSVQRQCVDDSDCIFVQDNGERIVAQAERESTP